MQIHTKKRNRLSTSRMNNLVFVQFNTRLLSKRKKQKEKNIDILVADDAVHAQEWLVEGDGEEHESAMGVGSGDAEGEAGDGDMADIRELHDEDFVSDDEGEDFVGINLESDEDQVSNMYGEEENDG